MTQLKDFPNLAASFDKLKLSLDLAEAICLQTDAISLGVTKYLNENKSHEAFKYLKQMSKRNRGLISNLIGEDILQRIEKI